MEEDESGTTLLTQQRMTRETQRLCSRRKISILERISTRGERDCTRKNIFKIR